MYATAFERIAHSTPIRSGHEPADGPAADAGDGQAGGKERIGLDQPLVADEVGHQRVARRIIKGRNRPDDENQDVHGKEIAECDPAHHDRQEPRGDHDDNQRPRGVAHDQDVPPLPAVHVGDGERPEQHARQGDREEHFRRLGALAVTVHAEVLEQAHLHHGVAQRQRDLRDPQSAESFVVEERQHLRVLLDEGSHVVGQQRDEAGAFPRARMTERHPLGVQGVARQQEPVQHRICDAVLDELQIQRFVGPVHLVADNRMIRARPGARAIGGPGPCAASIGPR